MTNIATTTLFVAIICLIECNGGFGVRRKHLKDSANRSPKFIHTTDGADKASLDPFRVERDADNQGVNINVQDIAQFGDNIGLSTKGVMQLVF